MNLPLKRYNIWPVLICVGGAKECFLKCPVLISFHGDAAVVVVAAVADANVRLQLGQASVLTHILLGHRTAFDRLVLSPVPIKYQKHCYQLTQTCQKHGSTSLNFKLTPL